MGIPGSVINRGDSLMRRPGSVINRGDSLMGRPGSVINRGDSPMRRPDSVINMGDSLMEGLPIRESPLLITTRSSRERFAHVNNRTIIYTNHLSLFVILHDCVVFLSNRIAESIYIIAMFCNP
jgi:hypothetical protein